MGMGTLVGTVEHMCFFLDVLRRWNGDIEELGGCIEEMRGGI